MSAERRPLIKSGSVINLAIIVVGLVAIAALLIGRIVAGDDAESGDPLELKVALEPAATGLDAPVLLIGAQDGSDTRYVVEQSGRVMRLTAEGSVDPRPFLDIRGRVTHQGEQGLLGLAFHPGYAENRRFFVAYSRRDDGATSISEFSGPVEEDARADRTSERPLLTIPQPYRNHNGGMLAFDHDGMLLAGIGDGGSADDPHDNGQDPASLLGTMLRLDVDRGWPYASPPDNGFAGVSGAKPEIHAIGLRNPWRFSVDGESGDIYIGDVGQNRWEEVNVLARGAREPDFGWNEMEGRKCFDGSDCERSAHLLPAVAYRHDAGDVSHCSVIGGYAYRGEAGTFPDGTYLYADYCSGTIWAVPAEQLLAEKAAPARVGAVPGRFGLVQSFGQDDAGELYLLTNGGYVLALSEADSAETDSAEGDPA